MLKRLARKTVAALLRFSSTEQLERLSDEMLRLRIISQEILRQREARNSSQPLPCIKSMLTGEILARSILTNGMPWDFLVAPECNVPGMLTKAEKRYYGYITQFYSGSGSFVEVGPWLGQSTFYLVSSLLANPSFSGKNLYVYDDFIWRSSWMNRWLEGTAIAPLDNHASFLHLFQEQSRDLASHLVVRRQKICDYDGNEKLPCLEWHDGPIEVIVVDCGRSLAVNEGWWNIFKDSFIPGKTLIIMQDWQNHKRVPEVFWENTKIFTDSKEGELDLVHEIRDGAIATFLYRGPSLS
ncbi:MAG: hypothetical protein ACK52U_12620 [Synechococcaceae cyanobacterium]|jgi:hypothetical protein